MKNVRDMKKKNAFLVLGLLSCLHASARLPFVAEGKVWNCKMTTGIIYSYEMKGDTLIGAENYEKVLICDMDTYQDTKLHYFAAVRETEDAVYIVRQGSEIEELLYDLAPGEKVINHPNGQIYKLFSSTLTYVHQSVRRIDTFNYGIHVAEDDIDAWATALVRYAEGVGMERDPFFGRSGYNVSCYEQGQCIFELDDFYNIVSVPDEVTVGLPNELVGRSEFMSKSALPVSDLLGRRIVGTRSKGVSVENGRKVLVAK